MCYSSAIVHWTFNDGTLPDNVQITTTPDSNQYILTIIGASLENEGFYECSSATLKHGIVRARGYVQVICK